MRGTRRILLGSALLACLALPSSSMAATTFGADLSISPTNSTHVLSMTNVVAPGGGPDTGAPVSGILTSVRIRTRGDAGTGVVRVLTETSHPDAMTYGFLNTAPEIPVTVTADVSAAGHITEVLTRRPIAAGQRLAWFINDPLTNTQEAYTDPTAECAYLSAGSTHTEGTTQSYTTIACNMNVVLLSGTIEADADGDGFGDETQDLCPTNAATAGACPAATPVAPASTPKKKKCKKKKRKGKAAAAKKCKKKKRGK